MWKAEHQKIVIKQGYQAIILVFCGTQKHWPASPEYFRGPFHNSICSQARRAH